MVHSTWKRDGNGRHVTLSSYVVMVTHPPLVDLEQGRKRGSERVKKMRREREGRDKTTKREDEERDGNRDRRRRVSRAMKVRCQKDTVKRIKEHKVKRDSQFYELYKGVLFSLSLNKSTARAARDRCK